MFQHSFHSFCKCLFDVALPTKVVSSTKISRATPHSRIVFSSSSSRAGVRGLRSPDWRLRRPSFVLFVGEESAAAATGDSELVAASQLRGGCSGHPKSARESKSDLQLLLTSGRLYKSISFSFFLQSILSGG